MAAFWTCIQKYNELPEKLCLQIIWLFGAHFYGSNRFFAVEHIFLAQRLIVCSSQFD
jgi:hypothetical protein